MLKKKARPDGYLGPREQRRLIQLIGTLYAAMGPVMRAELRGTLEELDNMSRDQRTYRALFRGMKTEPGQLVMKVAAEMQIEVWAETKDRWRARYWPSNAPVKGMSAGSREGIQAMTEAKFTEKLEDWITFLKDGSVAPEELNPDSTGEDAGA